VIKPTPESILAHTSHRPGQLPSRPWRLSQRWNDLLFCHWPIPPAQIQALLPPGLEVDTFDGSAWAGVIPFWMDQVVTRTLGQQTVWFPTTTKFSELNLRTYVRSRVSGLRGVFFFSLDCSSLLAVFGARTLFHLPYFPASMQRETQGESTLYRSRRIFFGRQGQPAAYDATFEPVSDANPLPQSMPGTLEYFLTERYCLFTPFAGRMLVGHIHHLPWSFQPAEAEIRLNQIPAAHGITLPDTPPILHFSRELHVLLWSLRTDAPGNSSYR